MNQEVQTKTKKLNDTKTKIADEVRALTRSNTSCDGLSFCPTKFWYNRNLRSLSYHDKNVTDSGILTQGYSVIEQVGGVIK